MNRMEKPQEYKCQMSEWSHIDVCESNSHNAIPPQETDQTGKIRDKQSCYLVYQNDRYVRPFNAYQSSKLPLVVSKIKWPPRLPKMDTTTPVGKDMLPEKI